MSSQPANGGRVLIFIVAYNAERHIAGVFERIPAELLSDSSVDILVIDDASTDAGAHRASSWARDHGVTGLRVLRNPVNQGYGGNQKLGFRLALDSGYDLVILLHGDGQYAPELLARFIETWKSTRADVILGSRIKRPGEARRGGMPMYKFAGNRILTFLQNRISGMRLSEFHTGYRAYSADFLRRVPFETLTNDFHFDTEILLQAAHVQARIEEFAIPTRYGDEICHVNGFRYAFDVLVSTIRFRFHQLGMLCDLKFRHLQQRHFRDATGHPYSSHQMALDLIDQTGGPVLDIRAGNDSVARRCAEKDVSVEGIELIDEGGAGISKTIRFPDDLSRYHLLLLLDVLEQMEDPEAFLLMLRNQTDSGTAEWRPPLVAISTANVGFLTVRLNLLLGRFPYAERGILDIAHRRLFTRASLTRTLQDCGYSIESTRGVAVPFRAVWGGRLGRMMEAISGALARVWPSLFGFQIFVICRPLPGVQQLLRRVETVDAPSRPGRVAQAAASGPPDRPLS